MSTQWHGGKGSSRRPSSIDRAKYEENYHRIFGYKEDKNRCLECGETSGQHTIHCIHYQRTAVDDAANVMSNYKSNPVTENGQDWYEEK